MTATYGTARGAEPEGAALALAVITQRVADGGDRAFLCPPHWCICNMRCFCVLDRGERVPLERLRRSGRLTVGSFAADVVCS